MSMTFNSLFHSSGVLLRPVMPPLKLSWFSCYVNHIFFRILERIYMVAYCFGSDILQSRDSRQKPRVTNLLA